MIKTSVKHQNSEPVYNYIQNIQPDNAQLLCYELDYIKEDTIYIAAVKMIRHILNEKKNDNEDIY